MAILLDTSFLLAVRWPRDKNHVLAIDAAKLLEGEKLIVTAPLLAELFYMMRTRASYRAAAQFYNFLRSDSDYRIEALTDADMARMAQIMGQYADVGFDYVDTAIMALSERLRITTVLTFDRRDFSVFRPAHTPALTLLP